MIFPLVSISIVSHGQISLVKLLLEDLERYCANAVNVLLTLNIPEPTEELFTCFSFPILFIKNTRPKGFGQNHNAAFQQIKTPFFCVMNPDIRLKENPFPPLINALQSPQMGVIGPMIIDPKGNIQDTARQFMGIPNFLKRIFLFKKNMLVIENPDWIAGMFMLFKREAYQEIKGFNEKYFLYCEDMDICARLKEKGYNIGYTQLTCAAHDARRESHKNIRYFIWHVKSLFIFWYYYYFQFKHYT